MSSRLGYTTTRVSFSSRSVIILLITEIISSFMCNLLVLDNQRVYFNYGFRVYLGDKFDDLVFTRIGYLIDNHKKIYYSGFS
jgi:voltage-gated potassium channel Kch